MLILKQTFEAILANLNIAADIIDFNSEERICLIARNGTIEWLKIELDHKVNLKTLCDFEESHKYDLIPRSPVPALMSLNTENGDVRFLIHTNCPRWVDLTVSLSGKQELFQNLHAQLDGVTMELDGVDTPGFVLIYGVGVWFVENKTNSKLMTAFGFTLGDKPDVDTAIFNAVDASYRQGLTTMPVYAHNWIKATYMITATQRFFYLFLASRSSGYVNPGMFLAINLDTGVFNFNDVFGQQNQTHPFFEGMDFNNWSPSLTYDIGVGAIGKLNDNAFSRLKQIDITINLPNDKTLGVELLSSALGFAIERVYLYG